MKRLIITVVVLVGLAALCMGQRKARVSPLKIIQLSPPNQTGSLSLEQVLIKQQTVSRFTEQPLSFTQIGQLAWAAQLITEPQKTSQTATAPSTPTAAYHINLYVAAQDGLFLYHPDEHTLEGIIREDLREKLSEAAPNKEAVAGAPCSIIIAGSPKRNAARYSGKAQKLMLLDAGRIVQNVHLQALSLELASLAIADFNTNKLRKICRLSQDLEPIYLICVGYPPQEPNSL
jgi:SagB-type dehydrogenase family enzyme